MMNVLIRGMKRPYGYHTMSVAMLEKSGQKWALAEREVRAWN